jgi:hypothetical protein
MINGTDPRVEAARAQAAFALRMAENVKRRLKRSGVRPQTILAADEFVMMFLVCAEEMQRLSAEVAAHGGSPTP